MLAGSIIVKTNIMSLKCTYCANFRSLLVETGPVLYQTILKIIYARQTTMDAKYFWQKPTRLCGSSELKKTKHTDSNWIYI